MFFRKIGRIANLRFLDGIVDQPDRNRENIHHFGNAPRNDSTKTAGVQYGRGLSRKLNPLLLIIVGGATKMEGDKSFELFLQAIGKNKDRQTKQGKENNKRPQHGSRSGGVVRGNFRHNPDRDEVYSHDQDCNGVKKNGLGRIKG